MRNLGKKIDVASNVLVIAAAVLVIGLLLQRYVFSTAQPPLRVPTIGKKLSLGDFDWSKSGKNVMLVMQQGCHYCEESADFYKRLIQQSQGKNIKFTAVFPQTNSKTAEYLRNLGLAEIKVKQAEFDALDVEGTPTIIVINEQGEISNAWRGKLSLAREQEVIASLNP